MRSTRTNRKLRSRAVSIAVCIALIICAVLSFGFILNDRDTSAEAETSADGIKFVQVAAGEDFAIGLTYDNKLYGWSLLPNSSGNETGLTLGRYYSNTPTQIDFKFIQGPTSNGEWNTPGYHNTENVADNSIKQIVATRYSAAFVTGNGAIYTWGRDTGNYIDVTITKNSGVPHPLLLRNAEDTTNANPWYKPYMIDYEYYKHSNITTSQSALRAIRPTLNNISIAAGEYNYIVAFTGGNYIGDKSAVNSTKYSFVWGSRMYNVHNAEPNAPYAYVDDGNTALSNTFNSRVYASDTEYAVDVPVTAVAGGHTVGMYGGSIAGNGGTNLMLRGDNFLNHGNIDVDATDAISELTLTSTTELVSTGNGNVRFFTDAGTGVADKSVLLSGALAGMGVSHTTGADDLLRSTSGVFQIYGRQATGSTSTNIVYGSDLTKSTTVTFADGKAPTSRTASFVHYGVSLGNDIGYGISAAGALYGWGDNADGQIALSANANEINPVTIYDSTVTGFTGFISVAAGRQLSSRQVAFFGTNTSNPVLDITEDGSGKATAATFLTGTDGRTFVANDSAFITGALTTGGRLFVWSNDIKNIKEIVFGDKNSGNELSGFAAVYSGYGNNLFAVTKLGKLVRITVEEVDGVKQYVQTVYDSFVNIGSTKAVNNWSVAYSVDAGNKVTVDNSVEFTVTKAMLDEDGKAPALGSITLFVDNAYSDQASVRLNGVADPDATSSDPKALDYRVSEGKGDPLVKSNAIGDSYRMLSDEIDGGVKFLRLTGDAADKVYSASALKLKPVFKFNGTVMSEKQQQNMFDYSFVYENESIAISESISKNAGRVGIKISPKQSSQGGVITVEFYIARYDSAINFTCTSKTDVTDDAVYYDYKKCAVNFTVADTPTYKNMGQFADDADGNSEVPLLDPNNEYNKYYSIAVQDVSGGIDALVKHLKNVTTFDKTTDSLYLALLQAMSDPDKGDKGFPLKQKADDGELDYYLGSDVKTKYYTDSYKYFLADRDADLIMIADPADLSLGEKAVVAVAQGANGGSVVGQVNRVSISGISLSGITQTLIDNLNTDFNNKYGLYDIKVNDDNTLSFKYDVVLFEAVDATGNLRYKTASADDTATGVDQYITDKDGSFMGFDVRFKSYGVYGYTDGVYAPVRRDPTLLNDLADSVAAVYSQPSVRFNKNGTTYYGDASAGNNLLEIDWSAVRVGDEITIRLKDYVNVTGADIAFSYKDATSGYDKFNEQWSDQSNSGIKVVELNNSTLTVRPTVVAGLYVEIIIQRFFDGNKTFGDDEKITLSFTFDNITDFAFTALAKPPTFSIPSQGGVFDVFGSDTALNKDTAFVSLTSGEVYRNNIKMVSVESTDHNVVTVVKLTESTFSVRPVNSGSALINVVMRVFDKTALIKLPVNVAGVTQIAGDLKLNSVVSPYVNALMTEIKEENSFIPGIDNYGILYNDVDEQGRPNAVVFYDTEGNKLEGYPSYVGKVTFIDTDTTNPRLRIEINNDALDTQGRYIVRVRFVDKSAALATYAEYEASGLTVLETAQGIRSTKLIVPTSSEDKSIFTIAVDCDAPKRLEGSNTQSDWWVTGENTTTQVHIPVRFLLEKAGAEEPDAYRIFLVSAEIGANKYFNYTSDAVGEFVIIEPLFDTPNAFTLSISVAPKTLKPNGENINQIVTFRVSTTGISTTLPLETYKIIWIVAFFASLGLLMVIFLIRMIIYWRRRAKQRQLIKRNQELIRMRDRVHNKANAATRDQVVKSKMKMEDPKYAKMYNDMRKAQRQNDGMGINSMGINSMGVNSTGVILESMSQPGEDLDKKGKKKKKKGGKKSIAELKAELEAKKAAFAQAQNGEPVNTYGADMGMQGGAPFEPYGAQNGGFGAPNDGYAAPDIDNTIVFDVDGQG